MNWIFKRSICLKAVIALGMFAGVLAFAENSADCGQMDAPTVSRILHTATKLFRTSPDVPSIEEQKLVPGTCYWQFSLSVPTSSRRLTLYLSPDKRFLSATLWDLSVDPEAADREVAVKLTEEAARDRAPVRGRESAPVTVVMFSDFECPHCATFAATAEHYRKDHPNDVRFIFRNSPLSQHPWAVAAAHAGICIAQQSPDAFWQYYDSIFAKQKDLTVENVKSTAEGFVGSLPELRKEEYSKCVAGSYAQKQLERDLAEARTYDVHGTPTVFINGARYGGFRDEAAFASAVQRARQLETQRKADGE